MSGMQAIPEDIPNRFNAVLKQQAVHEPLHVHYKKWLRYFIDFCRKYSPETRPEQVRLFIEKLKSKKQTPQQCKQAAHAVSLFFESQQPTDRHLSSSAEGKNLHSPRSANHPTTVRVAKSAVTGDIGLPTE